MLGQNAPMKLFVTYVILRVLKDFVVIIVISFFFFLKCSVCHLLHGLCPTKKQASSQLANGFLLIPSSMLPFFSRSLINMLDLLSSVL
jgi:hypothetical protein